MFVHNYFASIAPGHIDSIQVESFSCRTAPRRYENLMGENLLSTSFGDDSCKHPALVWYDVCQIGASMEHDALR